MKKVLTILMLGATIPSYALAEGTSTQGAAASQNGVNSAQEQGAASTNMNASQSASAAVSVQNLNRNEVMEIQQALQTEGLYQGRIDGIWGQKSASALTTFQQNNDLPATGALNTNTLNELGVQVSSASDMDGRTDIDDSSVSDQDSMDDSMSGDNDADADMMMNDNTPSGTGTTPFNSSPAENTDTPSAGSY